MNTHNNINREVTSPYWWLVVVMFYCAWHTPLHAQYNPLQFTHFTIDNGMPSMKVYDLAQDRDGFIWFATEAGIAKFDGYEFQNYSTIDGMLSNEVFSIYPDSKGRIWLGGLGPLSYYDGKAFHRLLERGSSFNFLGLDVQETTRGDFWVAWNGQLLHFDANLTLLSHKWEDFFKRFQNVNIFGLTNDSLWVNYRDQVVLLDLQKEEMYEIELKHTPANEVFFGAVVEQDKIYYSSSQGIVLHHLSSGLEQLVLPGISQVRKLAIHNGYLWLSTFGRGIEKVLINEDGSLADQSIKVIDGQDVEEILWDREDNTWIPSLGNGVFFYPAAAENMRVFTEKDGLKSSKVQSIFSQGDSLWLGDDRGGLTLITDQTLTTFLVENFSSRALNRILKIDELPSGAFLLATDLGLIRWTPQRSQTLFRPAVKHYHIKEDQIVITTHQGAYQTTISFLDQDELEPFSPNVQAKVQKLYNDRAYANIIDTNGDIWLGTTNRGVIQIRDGESIYWAEKSPSFKGTISAMTILPDSTLVLATNGSGLIYIKGDEYFQMTTEDGLSSNVCNDLAIDNEWLWVGHNRGISGIHALNFQDKTSNSHIEVYSKKDGLITNEIETIAVSGKNLVLGSHQGALIVAKNDLTEKTAMPNLQITDFWVNGEEVSAERLSKLAPEENNLRFKFSGVSFSNQQNIQYEYRLVGSYGNWLQTRSREILLSNISPGNYILEVRIVQEGQKGQPSAVPFTIRSHFYETLWFQGFILLSVFFIFGMGIFSYYNARQRQVLVKVVEEKTARLNEKLLDLAALNQQLEFSNKELEQFAHVASHDLKAPLRNVSSFIQVLERTAGKKLSPQELEFLHYAIKGTRRMDEIINDLLELAKVNRTVNEQEEVEFKEVILGTIDLLRLEIEERKARITLNGEFPKLNFNKTNARRIFENLISNALKYQGESSPIIEISCRRQGHIWLFSVKDNGIGIDQKYQDKVFQLFQRLHNDETYSGTGLGLAICKKIVEKSKGQIWFDSTPGKGATFHFTLPAQ